MLQFKEERHMLAHSVLKHSISLLVVCCTTECVCVCAEGFRQSLGTAVCFVCVRALFSSMLSLSAFQ
jgi:hypothetical protein